MKLSKILLWSVMVSTLVACDNAEVKSPDGMKYFHGGEIMIGSENGSPNEAPVFKTEIEPFFIDKSPVTVAEFQTFVEETGYVTEAEKFGNSAVLNTDSGKWQLIEGANWEKPFGIDGEKAEKSHPVTHVSWNDAQAYAEWAGRRLPTELEWEYAAKGGRDTGNLFSWGNELVAAGSFKANVWQGDFPFTNSAKDGYEFTSPVGAFGETKSGLTDMGGNVWEWTSSIYKPYKGNSEPFTVSPDLKVIRGGSFLCQKQICYGYRVTARQFNSRESATFHMGFRTAKDASS